MRRLLFGASLLIMGLALSGCAAIAIVDTAVGVTSTVVGTAVDVTAGAVRAGSRAVTGPSKKKEIDCDDEDNKDEDECKTKD